MEVVVLLVAIVGVALIAIPRVRRRKAGNRTSPRKRTSTQVVAAAAVPASSAASWAPPAGQELDAWEDDLGWEGESEAAADDDAREAWADWRSTALTPEPAASAPEVEPEVQELPSVERWRARAEQDDEWVEDDDDGLGWEGEDEPPAPPGLWNGDGASPAPAGWSAGGGSTGFRDWSRSGAEPPAVAPEPGPAFATASATDVAAPASATPSDPELGRAVPLDDDWAPPITRTWGGAGSKPPAAAAKAAPRPAGRRVHPVLLVAVYAAIGIGLVVLLSTVLLGGSSETPKPASTPQPVRSTTTPSATPVQAKAT